MVTLAAGEIEAGAERVARPGDRDDPDVVHLRRCLDGFDDAPGQRIRERILLLRPIQTDRSDVAVVFDLDEIGHRACSSSPAVFPNRAGAHAPWRALRRATPPATTRDGRAPMVYEPPSAGRRTAGTAGRGEPRGGRGGRRRGQDGCTERAVSARGPDAVLSVRFFRTRAGRLARVRARGQRPFQTLPLPRRLLARAGPDA